MRVEMCKAFLGFVDARYVIFRHPPQGDIYGRDLFEPIVPLAKQFRMSCSVDIVFESFNRPPNRHVDEDSSIVVRPKVCRITFLGLEPPHEPGTVISKRVDLV